MFYRCSKGKDEARAIVVLTPSESKRLIAKGVKEMPEVKEAMKSGRIVIIGGTTNAYVAEELTGKGVHKFWFAAGRIAFGELGANDPEKRLKPIVLINGSIVDRKPDEVLMEFTAKDVYIKGANAVDPYGNAGILMSNDRGGTIGAAIGILQARGSHIIVPVGLEKLIPSVVDASTKCGKGRINFSTGDTVGLMPLVSAKVITEIQAIDLLFGNAGVKTTHVASGGVAGSEGSVVLLLEGEYNAIKEAFNFIKSLKGEKAVYP